MCFRRKQVVSLFELSEYVSFAIAGMASKRIRLEIPEIGKNTNATRGEAMESVIKCIRGQKRTRISSSPVSRMEQNECMWATGENIAGIHFPDIYYSLCIRKCLPIYLRFGEQMRGRGAQIKQRLKRNADDAEQKCGRPREPRWNWRKDRTGNENENKASINNAPSERVIFMRLLAMCEHHSNGRNVSGALLCYAPMAHKPKYSSWI